VNTVIESSGDLNDLHHLRLMALLKELVREKGYKGAAGALEIDPQTVTASAKTGQLSRRVRQALERARRRSGSPNATPCR